MTFRHWFMLFMIYGVLQILMAVGEGSTAFADADDVNAGIGFQVDTESSGAGFIGFMRNVLNFFTVLLPKLLWWNYGILNGELEIVQWILTLAFGGTVI